MIHIRTLSLIGLTLAAATPSARAASSADPLWGLMIALVQAAAPGVPVGDDGEARTADETRALIGDDDLRRMLDSAVDVAQQTTYPAPRQRPTYYYTIPRYARPATGGYQTFQNTVNAAVTYWTGQPPRPSYYNQQAAPVAAYAQPAAPIDPATQPAATAQPAAASGDPYGFTAWLNGVRAQYGLAPVSHDANLAAWANMNNAQQNSYGLGHHVMGPARRQNSAMGSFSTIGAQWLASPAHAAALLDPSIRVIGIAGMGAYWTFNAY
ncbi:CAP domain-containing protein [Tautonia sociabilis]|uniref:CAP domain-containing protein n=1 Tax=Tautonia sociabilis TaxID=2080755 RepID=A0A432MK98_9BACT|nr:CAP domain-containing protein [Tautonia sociabilis]RUL87627.1 CAP domain-containing protein [Tautonia sociabilis]